MVICQHVKPHRSCTMYGNWRNICYHVVLHVDQ